MFALLDKGEEHVVAACEQAVARLARALEDPEISCLVRDGDVLRNVAHRSRLRLIFEIPKEQGGIAWRTIEQGKSQLVEDVRSDPDYLTADPSVRSEIAAPIRVGDDIVAVLDLEFPERVFADDEVAVIREEAERLATSLRDYA
ncbi:MAG TPA: GAF domain-containing protein [Gaiellaceae bacterium]|nr:GAF domain-containing protein [Gaiellaceae bacterium]